MKWKPGQLLFYMVSVLTVLVWLWVRQGTPQWDNYAVATHSFGQITGLVGMTLFAMTFLLTTRAHWVERLFGGLDKVYKTHQFSGALAFVFLLAHPLLLVIKFIPANIKQAAIYLLPSGSIAVNFGIMALLGLTLLIVITLYFNWKYQNWKLSHKFMGLVFVLAIFHVFMVTTDITFYPVLRNYMIAITIIGFVAHIYGSYLRHIKQKVVYAVDSVKTIGSVSIITLSPKGAKLNYRAGQFVFIRFKDKTVGSEQHPFTIASAPGQTDLVFAIKNLGDYTAKIGSVKHGTIVEVEGPYGEFNSPRGAAKKIWIAGGIGVTPFVSMARDLDDTHTERIDFYCCTKNEAEAIFLDEFKAIAHKHPNFNVIPFYQDVDGIINADKIQAKSGVSDIEVFICGPPGMMRALSGQFRKKGVRKIHMEDFNFK